ncbi:phage tail length tape measure family protein [Pseudomonas aeruginosa]|nr:phage tail length tape measure family protein [Pseudomonas aeruginosa]
MAASLAKVNGCGTEAVAALSEITSTGKFTVEQIEQVGTTAVLVQEATGKAVSKPWPSSPSCHDDPVKASQQLNDRYHYLTASVYEADHCPGEAGGHAGCYPVRHGRL